MKTKIIPFDKTIAEKIQAGEIKGKIKTKSGHNVRIICFNKLGDKFPIVALIDFSCKEDLLEHPYLFTSTGICDYIVKDLYDLVLEVLDNEPQFKPFDKVLVRENNGQVWHCDFYSYTDNVHGMHYCVGHCGKQILPYEGNQELVGTCNEPKCK